MSRMRLEYVNAWDFLVDDSTRPLFIFLNHLLKQFDPEWA